METMFIIAAVWLSLAVLSAMLAYHLKISIALVEICVGTAAAAVATKLFGDDSLGSSQEWLRFLASTGAILLTFLAGAELDPKVIKVKWKEVLVVGFVGFLAPFLGCAAAAHYLLHWSGQASWLAGVALSTTSMAVVYAVMLETGFNATEYGKAYWAPASSTTWGRFWHWGSCSLHSPTRRSSSPSAAWSSFPCSHP